jgi:hypothetical protein
MVDFRIERGREYSGRVADDVGATQVYLFVPVLTAGLVLGPLPAVG